MTAAPASHRARRIAPQSVGVSVAAIGGSALAVIADVGTVSTASGVATRSTVVVSVGIASRAAGISHRA